MADAERDRQNWMDCYSRRPDRPKASTYRRVGSGSEADLLAAIQDLAAHLTDRCVRNAIDSAVQNVLDRRNGNDF